MASGRQSDISADTSRSLEAGRIVNRCLKAERGDRADTRHGHEPSDLRIVTRQLQNLTVEIVDLLFNGLARREQRPDHSINSGRSAISSSARTAKTLNLARPITRPTFLSRPRTWFADPYRSWRLRSYERSDRLRLGIDYALSHD